MKFARCIFFVAIAFPLGESALPAQANDKRQPDLRARVGRVANPAYEDPLPDGAVMRIGSNRMRHLGEVRQIRITSDGSCGASIGADNVFCLWDLKTGVETRRIPLADGPARNDAPLNQEQRQLMLLLGRPGADLGGLFSVISDDAKTLVVSSAGKVRFYDTVAGKETARLDFKDDKAGVVALSPDGKSLARFIYANDKEGELVLHDLPGGKPRQKLRLGRRDHVSQLCFSSDGKFLAGCDAQAQIILWDLTSGKRVRSYEMQEPVTALTFVPRTHKLASATNEGVSFWELSSEEETAKLPLAEIHACAMAFSADGATLATTGKDNSIILWNVATGAQRGQLPGQPSAVSALAFSPDGQQLVAGAMEGTIHVWNLTNQREITPVVHRPKLNPLAFLNAGTLVVRSGPDAKLQHLEISSGKVLKHLFAPADEKTGQTLVAPNGKVSAALDLENGAVQLWDPERNTELHRFEANTNRVSQINFSADAGYLACLGNDKNLRVWNTKTGKEVHRLETPFTLEDTQVVRFGRGNMNIIGIDRPKENGSVPQVVISHDHRFLVGIGYSTTAFVWEFATGKERARFNLGNAGISSLILSPDDRLIATVSNGEIVRVWDTLRGKLVHGFFLSEGEIQTLAFSPSSDLVAVGSRNGTVLLLDVKNGKEKRRFLGHRGTVSKVLFAPDGKTLVSAGEEGSVLVWNVAAPPPQPAQAAAPSEARLAQWWERLGHADAAEACQAMTELLAQPRPAVQYLRQQMKPAPAVAPARVQQLIVDLRAGQFSVREKASRELLEFDTQVIPAFTKILAEAPPAEVARRIRDIMEKLDERRLAPENLRNLRAVELLERIGSPDASALLATLAEGAPAARLTVAAAEAAKRRRNP